jgi:hypothetical protein
MGIDHETLKTAKFIVDIKTNIRHIRLEFNTKEELIDFLDEPDIRDLLEPE